MNFRYRAYSVGKYNLFLQISGSDSVLPDYSQNAIFYTSHAWYTPRTYCIIRWNRDDAQQIIRHIQSLIYTRVKYVEFAQTHLLQK